MLFEIFKEILRRRLFELFGVVDPENEFCVVLFEHGYALFEGEYLPAPLTVGKHHHAEVESVDLCVEFCLFKQSLMPDVHGVETAEHDKCGKIVFVRVVVDDFQHNFNLDFKIVPSDAPVP